MNTDQWDIKLLDYFSGALSSSERQEVEKWIEESEDHQKIARDIQYIYSATNLLNDIKQIDAPRALHETKKKIYRKKKVSLFVHIQQIAAILLLPLL